MFNEAQLAIIKRAMVALSEREMHMNNVVSQEVQDFIEELNATAAPKAKKAKVVEEPVAVEAPAEEPKAE